MNSRARRRGLVAAAAALVLAPLAAGCATASFDKQIQRPFRPTDGYNYSLHQMQIRNIFVLGPKPGKHLPVGGSAPVYFSLVNERNKTDKLVSIKTPVAKSVSIKGGSIRVASGQFVKVATTERAVVLHGLTRKLGGNQIIPLTLRFRDAGVRTFRVPVNPYTRHLTSYAPAPAVTAEPTASKTPKASKTPRTPGATGASPEASKTPDEARTTGSPVTAEASPQPGAAGHG